jgi:hypothetical protein
MSNEVVQQLTGELNSPQKHKSVQEGTTVQDMLTILASAPHVRETRNAAAPCVRGKFMVIIWNDCELFGICSGNTTLRGRKTLVVNIASSEAPSAGLKQVPPPPLHTHTHMP